MKPSVSLSLERYRPYADRRTFQRVAAWLARLPWDKVATPTIALTTKGGLIVSWPAIEVEWVPGQLKGILYTHSLSGTWERSVQPRWLLTDADFLRQIRIRRQT